MKFTRSDLVTFALGALAAVALTAAQALSTLDEDPITDWQQWGVSLGAGLLAALGRYLVTALPLLIRRSGEES
jgi:hypothetical protein